MPALYIANPTNQEQQVCYRIEFDRQGNKDMRQGPANQQNIKPGRQEIVGDRDFHKNQVDAIIRQLEPFGLFMADNLSAVGRDQRVIYLANIGLPVPEGALRRADFHNRHVKTLEGAERRRAAAVATNQVVQEAVNNRFMEQGIDQVATDETSVSIEQDEQTEMGESRIEEGFDIVPAGKLGRHSGKPAEGRKRKRK